MRTGISIGIGGTLLIAGVSLAMAVAGCSSSGGGGSTGPDTVLHAAGTHVYVGGMAGLVSHNGLLVFTIDDTGAVSPMNGTYHPIGGAAVTMGGSLDRGNGSLTFGGGGYGATGVLDAGRFTGAWTLDSDSGAFAAVSGSGSPLGMCGFFQTHEGGVLHDSGVVVLLLNGDSGLVVSAQRVHPSGPGDTEGNVISVLRSGNSVSFTPDSGTSGAGTISGSSVSGTTTDPAVSRSGTFGGSAANCGA